MDNLHYFKKEEFERDGYNWFEDMDTRLLVLIDVLRYRFDDTIEISSHPRAIGRHDGDSGSYHNIDKHEKVYAIDLLPKGTKNKTVFEEVLDHAFDLGFTGIGAYPYWDPRPGIHVDTRPDRDPKDPATWGYIKEDNEVKSVSLDEALEKFDDYVK